MELKQLKEMVTNLPAEAQTRPILIDLVTRSEEDLSSKVALAVAQKELANLQARHAAVESELATLQQISSHPPGLCGHEKCEPCNAEIQGITQSVVPEAVAEGRKAALTDMHQALVWGGGEDFAGKVTRIVQTWVQKGRPEPAKEPALIIMG